MPKYLLRLRKISFFLIDRSSAISVGSYKASSKAKATWHPIPPLKFLSDASSLRGSPCSMEAGSQAWGSSGRLSPLSTPLSEVWPDLWCLATLWPSSLCSTRDLPVSATSLPFCSLFLLGSAGSGLDGKNAEEEEEDEIWDEEEVVWAGWIFLVHLSQAGTLLNPANSFGFSSRYPFCLM